MIKLDLSSFAGARKTFNKGREGFYDDLAEAIKDKESPQDFLENLRSHCAKSKYRSEKKLTVVYARMLQRLEEEEGRYSHMLKTIVPDGDLLSLSAIDDTVEEQYRIESFRFLAEGIRGSREMFATIRNAVLPFLLVTPILLIFAVTISVVFVPQYASMMDPKLWGLWGKMLYAVSYVITNFGVALSIAGAGLIYLYLWSLRNWVGPNRVAADRKIIAYRLYRDFNAARFIQAQATLMQAKIAPVDALESLKLNASPWLAWHIRKILNNLDEWPDDYARAFDTGLLPPEIHLRLASYARRSNFAEGLVRLGGEGMKHVKESVKKSSFNLNLVTLVVTALLIVFFYGGNAAIGRNVKDYMKELATQTSPQ